MAKKEKKYPMYLYEEFDIHVISKVLTGKIKSLLKKEYADRYDVKYILLRPEGSTSGTYIVKFERNYFSFTEEIEKERIKK